MKMIKDNKLLLKIFSGLIAVVLWFLVTYTEDPSINQGLNRLDTFFANEEQLAQRGLMIVNKDDLPSFSVTIRGQRSKVIASLEKVYAIVDVSKITVPGAHEVPVDYRYPTDSVMITKSKHSSVTVTAERLFTRDIPIRISTKPNKKDTSHIIETKSHIDTVSIGGAQSLISKIAYAGFEIDESGISSNSTTSYTYKLYDANNNVLDEKNLYSKSHDTIPVTHTIYNKVDVPVNVVLADELNDSYSLNIKEQNPSWISIGVSDNVSVDSLTAIFKEEHLNNEQDNISLPIEQPEGVYIPYDNRNVYIKYELSEKRIHEIEVPVSITNVPDGRFAAAIPEKIRVRVKCADFNASPENISATLDLNTLSPGSANGGVLNITTKDGMQVIGTYKANAIIS